MRDPEFDNLGKPPKLELGPPLDTPLDQLLAWLRSVAASGVRED